MRFLAPLFLGAFCFAINTLPAAFAQSSAQSSAPSAPAVAQPPALPPEWVVSREFSDADKAAFATPPRVNFPQTWFHFLGGNVSREGITADLSAIAGAGISGVQLFHGSQGNWPWPGTKEQITCLSPKWDDTVRFAAEEARRLGLRFTMQNCPGWSMAGGPWVKPEDAQRRLVWSATQVELKPTAGSTVGGSQKLVVKLPHPPGTAPAAKNPAADYRDIAVLAFPTPLGWETGQWLRPLSPVATRNVAGAPAAPKDFPWRGIFDGTASRKRGPLPVLPPAPAGRPWQIEVAFAAGETPRSVELPPVKQMAGNGWEYDPRLTFAFSAVFADGSTRPLLETPLPQSAWQNNHNTTLALPEVRDAAGAPPVAFRVAITNAHPLSLAFVRFTSSAKPHNYEAEAGWTLRGKIRAGESPAQNPAAFVPEDAVVDVSEFFDAATGVLNWERGAGSGERGNYTFLRFGHINAGHRNAPAPREGTGWECDKLSERGPDAHFAGYIGRLAKGPLAGGLLQGVLLDSWECYTQTWTRDLERDFAERARYPLRRWLPAVAGYVVGDHSRTNRFLLDWRRVIGDLFANKFYGRMAKLARDAALDITYETAAGDIFPADLLEYYKHADVPMTEFWQPFEPRFVGSINFKPIKPAASAARLYGKRRTAAEAFTSFQLTWDERLADFKEIGNFNATEGVTHLVFHTYSHNPQTGDAYHPPGTSFAAGIGSPFLRGQTWWKFMPEFTTYFARLGYMLERGVPVSDFLWFLGDEIVHKPDQRALTPLGHKYDYCNPDILRHRLSVDAAGNIVTPEGLTYRVLWLPDCRRLTIETLEALARLRRAGAVLAGNPPLEPATLTGGEPARLRFAQLVREIWGTAGTTAGESTAGESTAGGGASSVLPVYGQKRGRVITGATDLAALTAALRATGTAPDLLADGDAAALAAAPVFRDAAGFPHTDDIHGLLWTRRRVAGADWYFIAPPKGRAFSGEISVRSGQWPVVSGQSVSAELWCPVTGTTRPVALRRTAGGRLALPLNLARAEALFLVIPHSPTGTAATAGTSSVLPVHGQSATTGTAVPLAPFTLTFPAGWGAPTAPIALAALAPWKDLPAFAGNPEARAFSGTATYRTSFEWRTDEKSRSLLLSLGTVRDIAVVSLNGRVLRTLWAPPYTLDLAPYVRAGTNELTIAVTGSWHNRLVFDAGQSAAARKTWTIAGPRATAPLRPSGLLGPVTLTLVPAQK